MLTRLAMKSPGVSNGRVRMAAGIVYRRHLVATGVNQMKTHPMMMGDGYRDDQLFLHAEVDAIKNALKLLTAEELSKSSLAIVRVKRPYIGAKTWIHGLAKPCPGCQTIIDSFGIKDVWWTKDLPKHIDLSEERVYTI